jgi:hypothetical protein
MTSPDRHWTHPINIGMREWMNIVENALRNTDIKSIDVDDAIQHFDLPVDMNRADMRHAFTETKKAFMAMFRGQNTVTIYRAIDVEGGWQPANGLGASWAYDAEGGFMEKEARDGWIVLVGEVSVDDVDWATTIAVNTFHEDEREIVVERGSPVLLRQMLRFRGFGKKCDLIAEPNQTFAA